MNLNTYLKQLSSYTPNGSQTLSKMASRYPQNYPQVLVRGSGGKVYDSFGNCFVDLISGLGAVAIGYANDYIDNAAYQQMRLGTIFSLPNPVEYEAAKRLTELIPATEQWKFGKNGTDGTVMAVRAARALTGRMKIMTVGYNGCSDVFECQGVRNAGIPKVLKQYNTRARYNHIEDFEPLITQEFACVLMEPMVFDEPKADFLGKIKQLCTATRTLLIFDEVVNGGRFEDYVSSRYFEVGPDMYVLGKGLANGFPLCAVGGARPVMSVFERNDFFASGTYGGECVSLAAFLETSHRFEKGIAKMLWNGNRIKDAFNKLPWPENTECKGYPTRLNFVFPSPEHKFLFWQEMCKKGVLVGYANFIKADNTDEEVTAIIEAMYSAFKVLLSNWSNPKSVFVGPMPEEALKGRSN